MLSQLAYDAEQFVLRLAAPKCAAHADAGQLRAPDLRCDDPDAPAAVDHARGPRKAGWIEILYKVVGPGLHALAPRKAGDTVSVLGPDRPAASRRTRRGRARCCWAAASASRRWCSSPSACARRPQLQAAGAHGLGGAVSVSHAPLRIIAGMPAGAIACMPLLEEWGVPSRLASQRRIPRLLPRLRDRARAPSGSARWMPTQLAQVEIFSCGPTPMLRAQSRHWRAASRCPARCRSRSSWRARSAAAPAARCRCRPPRGRR